MLIEKGTFEVFKKVTQPEMNAKTDSFNQIVKSHIVGGKIDPKSIKRIFQLNQKLAHKSEASTYKAQVSTVSRGTLLLVDDGIL